MLRTLIPTFYKYLKDTLFRAWIISYSLLKRDLVAAFNPALRFDTLKALLKLLTSIKD